MALLEKQRHGIKYTFQKQKEKVKHLKSYRLCGNKNIKNLAIKPSVWAENHKGENMNQTIVKIAGIVAICLGSVALFLTGIGESAVIAIVSAVFVLAGLVAALFKPKEAKVTKASTNSIPDGFVELCALIPGKGLVSIGTVTPSCYEGVRKVLGAD